jgi:hypothetical protein
MRIWADRARPPRGQIGDAAFTVAAVFLGRRLTVDGVRAERCIAALLRRARRAVAARSAMGTSTPKITLSVAR